MDVVMEETHFHLRAELRGHEEDVRGVCWCDLGLITGSRDKTIRLWAEDTEPPTQHGFHLVTTMVGHTDYVGPVMYIPPAASPDYPNGAIVSGSRDTTVRVWDPATASCTAVLQGHEYQVTALGLLPSGEIVSSSLDKTLKLWSAGKCGATLTGHEGPVLCLLVLPGGEILSGSGDTTVRMWSGTTCIHTIKAHTDTVRALCSLPDIGFVTGSHDMTCKVWDSTGSVLAELVGHTALVYAVASAGHGRLVASGSEDNTARIWRPSGECLQIIAHPGNIWSLTFLTPSGDLATGCSDFVARVWTQNADKRAAPEVVEALQLMMEEQKAAAAAAKGEGEGAGGAAGGGAGLPAGLKVEESFVLSQPGTKDGENKFVRDGATGDVVAYAWDAKAFQWEKIGVVVEGPAGGGGGGGSSGGIKKFWAGKEWDFVIDVDIGEGAPPRKLACNADDNPYLVADRFLEQEQLPAEFREQIVQFIIQNTGGASRGPALNDMSITGGFCDPFTGGGPSTGSAGGPLPQQQRYQPAPLSSLAITGGGVDPFTGGAGSSGRPAQQQQQHIPCHVYLAFDNAPSLDALSRKLHEFNGGVAAAGGAALTEAELAPGGALEQLLQKLPQAASGSGGGITAADCALLLRLLSWPAAQLFPALDLARLAVLDPQGAQVLAQSAGDMASPQPGTLAGALSSAAASNLPANQQLALRLAANAFKHPPTRAWLASGGACSALLDAFAGCAAPGGGNKAVRLSLATLLGNVAAAAGLGHLPSETRADVALQAVSCGVELLGAAPSPLDESDAVYRCMVSMGTLVAAAGKELGEVALDLGLHDRMHAIMTAAKGGGAAEAKLLQAGIELLATISKATGRNIGGA